MRLAGEQGQGRGLALETVGCTAARVVPRQGPAPMEYVIGRRAATGAGQDGNG
jgi:hypothetical protein